MMPLKPIIWKATVTLRKVTFADEEKINLYVKYHTPEFIEDAKEVMIGEKLRTYTLTGTAEQVLSEIRGLSYAAEADNWYLIVERMERVES